jgi:hypothetical protein
MGTLDERFLGTSRELPKNFERTFILVPILRLLQFAHFGALLHTSEQLDAGDGCHFITGVLCNKDGETVDCPELDNLQSSHHRIVLQVICCQVKRRRLGV